ncbi:MAG: hypothetical protein ACOC45_04835 [Alkalispirochaetaceae bacterium]
MKPTVYSGDYRPGGVVSLLLTGLLILLPLSAPTQELTAAFLDGFVELDGEGTVAIGDVLPPEGTLLLDESGYLEIRARGRTVRLIGPGAYELSRIVGSSDQTSGTLSGVTGRVQRLIREERRGDLAAAGVRGDFAGEGEWASSPAAELRQAAEEALRAGRVEAAEELYQEALLYAVGTEATIRLDLAELHFSRGEAQRVLAVTEPIDSIDEMEPRVRGRYYLVRGAALLEVGAGREAVEFLLGVRGRRIPPETELLLELLTAEAAVSAGRDEIAREALQRVIELAPDTPPATAARRMLAAM